MHAYTFNLFVKGWQKKKKKEKKYSLKHCKDTTWLYSKHNLAKTKLEIKWTLCTDYTQWITIGTICWY